MTATGQEISTLQYALAKQIPQLLRGGHAVLQTNYGSIELQGSDAIQVGKLIQTLWQNKLPSPLGQAVPANHVMLEALRLLRRMAEGDPGKKSYFTGAEAAALLALIEGKPA